MNSVEFSKGVEATGVYTLIKKDKTEGKMKICKKETEELTYKLAFKHLGFTLKQDVWRDVWEVRINDKNLLYSNGHSLWYCGSRKFDVRPSSVFISNSSAVLEIEETDENKTGTILFDMSGRSPVVINKKLIDIVKENAKSKIEHLKKVDIAKENAKSKIAHLKEEYPNFKPDTCVYNLQGIGVFGWDEKAKNYAFYWASPSDKDINKINGLAERCRGDSYAKGKNQNGETVHFLHKVGCCHSDDVKSGYYLNDVLANELEIN